jgi:hypothetical protein
MLGALEWMQKPCHNQAAADWLRCVDDFENLRELAERDNFPQKEAWYAQHCDILRTALLEWVKPPAQIDPDNDLAEENGSQPHSVPSNPGKTDPYQELLAKVDWDRAMADRFIEFERKKAAIVDRNELIRRAIESLIRDNQ